MRRIGMVSAVSGAGSRFFASNFACYLAEKGRRPAVLELSEGGLYDALGMDKRFAGRTFFPRGGPPNLAAGVNWSLIGPEEKALPTEPEEAKMRSFYERLRLLDRTEGDVVLCLFSGLSEEERTLFLRDMDASFLVVDPLPSRLLLSFSAVQTLSKEPHGLHLLVNKMNGGVKKRELTAFLGKTPSFELPLLPAEEIYRAEYACRVPYEAKSVRDALVAPFRTIERNLF